MSENKLSVKGRIVAISNDLRIAKDGKNTFSNYNYFKPDDIQLAINPLLKQYELISIFNLTFNDMKYTGHLRIEDFNSDDKVEYVFDLDKAIVKGANEAQNSGATLTYAKRYSLMNAFNLADNDDDPDSDKQTAKNANNKKVNDKPANNKPANNTELTKLISDIDTLATSLVAKSISKDDIGKAIKSVLKDSKGNPSANYKSIKNPEIAKIVLSELNKLGGKN
jgi:hypothetical protein